MGFNLKKIFNRPTAEDKGNIYSFERIYRLAPRHYIIQNCSEGFMNLMKKSVVPCQVSEASKKVETEGRGYFEVQYGSENFASLLTRIMKGE